MSKYKDKELDDLAMRIATAIADELQGQKTLKFVADGVILGATTALLNVADQAGVKHIRMLEYMASKTATASKRYTLTT